MFKTEKAIVNPADIKEIKKEFDDKSVIINKIGLNEENADFLLSLSPTFAVWLADKIVESYTTILASELTREQAIKYLNKDTVRIRLLSERIRGILDWLQHPTTRKQNLRELSFAEAERKSKEWHDELKVEGGDINFVEPEENYVIKEYPENDNGVKYYWVYIPQSYCDIESRRMGHCGRTRASSLISLRSIRPYTENDTITDSHVTVAFDKDDGLIYQSKGKKNQKPAEKYFPYIFDLIKMLTTGDVVENIKAKNKDEIETLNARLKQYTHEMKLIENLIEDVQLDEIITSIHQTNVTIDDVKKYGEVENKTEIIEKLELDLAKEQEKYKDEVQKIITKYYKIITKYDNISEELIQLIINNPNNLLKYWRSHNETVEMIEGDLSKKSFDGFMTFKGFSTEYASSNDYGWSDMTKEEIKELYEINPELFNTFSSKYILYEAGLTDEKPNTEFILNQGIDYISNIISNDMRVDIISDYFTGDLSSIYEANWSYYYDNAEDYVDELKPNQYQEVIDKIVEITGLEKETVEENGAKHYLAGDDEEFSKDEFDDILRALAIALEQAENDDFSNYFYSTLKGSLEELGEVKELSDTGLTLKIDLKNILSVDQIGTYMESLETDSLEDVFWEAHEEGDIELPRFNIDDRYMAEPKDWQEYFDIDTY